MNNNLDLDNLNELYVSCIENGSFEERELLSENYLDLFSELCYDFACGKLTKFGLSCLIPIVEKVEALKGRILWSSRAHTYMTLMEDAEKNNSKEVIKFGERAIDALFHQMEEEPEDLKLAYENCTLCFYTLSKYDIDKELFYWEEALHYIKKAIQLDPIEANWIYYYKLLYTTLGKENLALIEKRKLEILNFKTLGHSLSYNQGLYFIIASQLLRFKEVIDFEKSGEFIFPEGIYFYWLEESMAQPEALFTTFELSNAGHFYHKEGLRLKRLDLLKKALNYFRKLYDDSNYGLYPITYISNVLEHIALLYKANGTIEMADDYMSRALLWNENKLDSIKNNFSSVLHYAEFLERCYSYSGTIPRPTLSTIKSIVSIAEKEGKGFYSGPYLLQARIASEENDETLAIVYICKSLILHELCIQEILIDFNEKTSIEFAPKMKLFLEETLIFMKEVNEGYYYNPLIKWEELTTMNDVEILEVWTQRKEEIRKRDRIF